MNTAKYLNLARLLWLEGLWSRSPDFIAKSERYFLLDSLVFYLSFFFFFYHLLFLAFTFHDASSGRAHWIVHWWICGDRQVPGYLGISLGFSSRLCHRFYLGCCYFFAFDFIFIHLIT